MKYEHKLNNSKPTPSKPHKLSRKLAKVKFICQICHRCGRWQLLWVCCDRVQLKTSRNENANKHQQSHFAAARLRKGKSSDYGDDDGEDEGNNNIQSAIKVKQMEILCCLMGISSLMGALFISLCWLVGREFRFYAALVPHPCQRRRLLAPDIL